MDKQKIISVCSAIASKGELFCVHRYRWSENKKRKNCFELKKQGKLKQAETHGKILRFYRPEDEERIEKSRKKHTQEMRNIFRENCRTMIRWARKDPKLTDYYIREFWKYKEQSWHYEACV